MESRTFFIIFGLAILLPNVNDACFTSRNTPSVPAPQCNLMSLFTSNSCNHGYKGCSEVGCCPIPLSVLTHKGDMAGGKILCKCPSKDTPCRGVGSSDHYFPHDELRRKRELRYDAGFEMAPLVRRKRGVNTGVVDYGNGDSCKGMEMDGRGPGPRTFSMVCTLKDKKTNCECTVTVELKGNPHSSKKYNKGGQPEFYRKLMDAVYKEYIQTNRKAPPAGNIFEVARYDLTSPFKVQ